MGNIIKELRRRNIFRVAGVYAVVGWLLVQIAVALEAAMQMPAWFDAVVTSFLLIGFPVAVILAWAFELTPDGVKRTAKVEPGASISRETGRKLDYALLIGLVVVAAIVLGDRFIPRLDDNSTAALAQGAPEGADLSDKSIAVLPFADLSPDGDQGYFADGLSEELLNVLAQIDELQVAGRTSSFVFKGDNRDLREIGELLNVAHILEGSVRKSGNKIRVTAQLINASNGYHVFSDTYEGDLSDIFKVQDEIATKITAALRTEWLGEESPADDAPDVAAFDLYLQARQLIYTRDKAKMEAGEKLLDQVLAMDPNYAPALAQKAIVNILLSEAPGSYGDRPQVETATQSLAWAEKAIALDPTLGEAFAAKGLAMSNANGDLDDVVMTLRRAAELNPGLSDAKNWLGAALVSQSKPKEAQEVYESIVEVDPFYTPAFNNLVFGYTYTGELDKAESLIGRLERVSGETADTIMSRGFVADVRGETAEALELFEQAMTLDPNKSVLRANYVKQLVKLGEYETALQEATTYQRPVVLLLLGRHEEAVAALDALPTPAEAGVMPLTIAMYAFGFSNRPEEAVAYLEKHFDSLDDAVDLSLYDAGLWLPFAAAAYRDTGRMEDFHRATELLDQAMQPDRDLGATYYDVPWIESMLAALRGDDDEAIRQLQIAVNAGMVSDTALRPAAFDTIRLDPRFKEIEVENTRRINEEREKLDLPQSSAM